MTQTKERYITHSIRYSCKEHGFDKTNNVRSDLANGGTIRRHLSHIETVKDGDMLIPNLQL